MSKVQYGRGAAAALVFGLFATLAAATVQPVSNVAVGGRSPTWRSAAVRC